MNGKLKDYWYEYEIDGVQYYWEETREVPITEKCDVSLTKTGKIGNFTYFAKVYYRYRTENSIQLKISWTSTMDITKSDVNAQYFVANVDSVSTGHIQIVEYDKWNFFKTDPNPNETHLAQASSPWITVPLNTTTATNVYLHIYFFQTDKDGRDLSNLSGIECLNETWSIALPDLNWN